MAALGVVPASRVAMDTSSLLIAFGHLLTFKAPASKLIISDEFKECIIHSMKAIKFKQKNSTRTPFWIAEPVSYAHALSPMGRL